MASPTPDTPDTRKRGRFRWLAITTLAASAAAIGGAYLLTNIFERKEEARTPFYRVVDLTDTTSDPAIWGKNFPQQYDDYRKTVDQVRTKYGGSEAVPHSPDSADPRSFVAQSRLSEDPRLVRMWAGYAFSVDFREERGHAFMLTDQELTKRQSAVKQPGACIHCHASVYVPYMKAGGGDLMKGFEKVNPMPYFEARKLVEHPVSCIDCHNPDNMALRITRPGFIEGIRALKASEGIQNYDVNTMATRQEMRSYVCGQCHVEYHFKGPEKRLTYPWFKGLKVDSILAWYDAEGFKDWVHKESGAPMLKAQHPEFELHSQGIHARSGVACADCHMPYKRVGAMKISDHHVRSPLLNINRACQTCHKWSEDELRARVETIQGRTFEMRGIAMDAMLELIDDIRAVAAADSNAPSLKLARDFHRKASFMLDFIEAENSMGFHASQESVRILGKSVNYSRLGVRALRGAMVAGR
ncbi:MAG TPA: ammonia-forming cytochrome c nitrite reductase subunit c552 [Candidatus Kapabacteria bacterium]|jgi:nitrite reductase (cytochrome c-552)|nr:ammonia-forming cytochrome c nitrite reductase subunit c552 [Candidatus Kapabacteria bacterium]